MKRNKLLAFALVFVALAVTVTSVAADYPTSFESKTEMQQLVNDRVGIVTPQEFSAELQAACHNGYMGTGELVSAKYFISTRTIKRTYPGIQIINDPTNAKLTCNAWIRVSPTRVYSYNMFRVSGVDLTSNTFNGGNPYFSYRAYKYDMEFLLP